jgi:protein phosphatase
MASNESFHWIASARTDVGMVRKVNEDACIDRAEIGLWAVADGMGGHAAGDLASGKIVEELALVPAHEKLSTLVAEVESRLTSVNDQLRNLAATQNMNTVGSTVAALVLKGRFGMCLWAGDSRVYRVRAGGIEQMTQDHAFVEDLVEKGILTREAAANHPQSNLVTRAVGAQDGLKLDLEIFDLQDNDIFVLCSDGLDKELSEQEIADAALRVDPSKLSDELVELALSRGSRDNVTVVAVMVKDGTATDFSALRPSTPSRAPIEAMADLPDDARTDFRRFARPDSPDSPDSESQKPPQTEPLLDDEDITIRRPDIKDD